MILHTNLGAVLQYNADQPPDAATRAIIEARGDTVELVDRTEQNKELSFDYQFNPFLAGGGNPLYLNPANIPTPPAPVLRDCAPQDTSCVQANQAEAAASQTLAMAYQQALNGAIDPTAPDRYVALLSEFQRTRTLPSSVANAVLPLGAPVPPTSASSSTSSNSSSAASGAATPQSQQSPVQSVVATGGKAIALSETPSNAVPVSSVPSWVWLAAAAGAGFFIFKGQK